MSDQYQDVEVYGSRALYGTIVAAAALLLVVVTVSSFTPVTAAPAAQHVAKTPTSIETVVVTPGQST